MKIQNSVFFNEHFTKAFKKLLSFEFDAPVTVRIVKSIKVLDEQQYAVYLTKDKILSTLAETDDNGAIIYTNGSVKFKSNDDMQKFNDQFNNLLRDEFEIPLTEKIKLTKAHKISAAYLDALDTIVEVIE